MDDIKLDPGELDHQATIEKIKKDIAQRAKDSLEVLEEKIPLMETFDLLSNITVHNHLQNIEHYEDAPEDRVFMVSELVALIALKHQYQDKTQIPDVEAGNLVREVQDNAFQYFNSEGFSDMFENHAGDQHSVAGIAFKTRREETAVRNPGMPEHHVAFSTELYQPIETNITQHFGFTVRDTVQLRNTLSKLVNQKINAAKDNAAQQAITMAAEVFKYRASKTVDPEGMLDEQTLIELNQDSRKKIKEQCYNYWMNDMMYNLGKVYSFTAEELAGLAGISLSATEKFLAQFSTGFPGIEKGDPIVGPNIILRKKPILVHADRYLVPSFPLVTWAVEPVIEDYIKTNQKLQDKFKTIKHNFLQDKAAELFTAIFKNGITIHQNLFYHDRDDSTKRNETDMIFAYDRTLFIIEAKGNRITQAAKEGKYARTEKHLEDIVKDSYDQGMRTLDFIKQGPGAVFYTKNNKEIIFHSKDYDEYVLVSLSLEPIGSLTPLIRSTNELGYFKKGIFPWIISLYDLIVIADHLEMPILLLHYIIRRKQFLEKKEMEVYDELDLLSYYLSKRLYIQNIYNEAMEKEVNMVHMANATDEINNFYMQRALGSANPPKLAFNIQPLFKSMLAALEISGIYNKQELMLILLELSPSAAEKFRTYIEKIKSSYAADGKKHDCAIVTQVFGQRIGISFMTGPDKNELELSLFQYCSYKLNQGEAKKWIGFADTERAKNKFAIVSSLVLKNE